MASDSSLGNYGDLCSLSKFQHINLRAAGEPISFLWLPSCQAATGLAAPAHCRSLWSGKEFAIFICLSLPSSLLNEFRHTEALLWRRRRRSLPSAAWEGEVLPSPGADTQWG